MTDRIAEIAERLLRVLSIRRAYSDAQWLEIIEAAMREAVKEERKRFETAHRCVERFADDLDTAPSTRLLATELRNRWRAALDARDAETGEGA